LIINSDDDINAVEWHMMLFQDPGNVLVLDSLGNLGEKAVYHAPGALQVEVDVTLVA
jgi:hypothetical protein